MSEVEYILTFPLQRIIFNENEITFSINHIKSRLGCIVYFRFNCFDKNESEIYTYTSPRWAIDTEYQRKARTFTIPQSIIDRTYFTQIELITIDVDSENPLYFCECMLNEGEDLNEYHTPYEQTQMDIGLFNSRYVNLYKRDGNFLQVIRPQGDNLKTNELTKSTCTVIAPHFYEESSIDDPINIFLEFLHQREQRIDVLR